MPSDDDSPILIYRRAGRGFSKRQVRLFAEKLRAEAGDGQPFTCLLTDDRELRRLNREFLGKDYPTDVLSFPEEPARRFPAGLSSDVTPPGPSVVSTTGRGVSDEPLGELAISVERATEQAAGFGHSVEDEIGILMLHGLLHLLGLDHENDRGRMARTERRWRKRLGLPVGLIERTKKK